MNSRERAPPYLALRFPAWLHLPLLQDGAETADPRRLLLPGTLAPHRRSMFVLFLHLHRCGTLRYAPVARAGGRLFFHHQPPARCSQLPSSLFICLLATPPPREAPSFTPITPRILRFCVGGVRTCHHPPLPSVLCLDIQLLGSLDSTLLQFYHFHTPRRVCVSAGPAGGYTAHPYHFTHTHVYFTRAFCTRFRSGSSFAA